MAMNSELIIKVDANIKGFQEEFKKIQAETKNLQDGLRSVGKKATVAFAALGGVIAGTIALYREQEQAQIRTEQTIKATGMAAGLTSKEIFDMASALQEVTTYGDEAIIGGQNLLLTFRNIGKDVFPAATEIMLDMSTAMGTDLKSSAIQLGKALNDPITGISALSRVGITFTTQQKEMIKSMQESGDTMGAQKVIMAELQNQFGGVARAAAGGTGVFISLKNSAGDLAEEIGKQLAPMFIEVAKRLKDFINQIKQNPEVAKFAAKVLLVGAAAAGIIAGISGLGLALLALKAGFLAVNTSMMTLVLNPVGATIVGVGVVVGALIYKLKELSGGWDELWIGMKATATVVMTGLADVFGAFGTLIKNIITGNFGAVSESLQKLRDEFSEHSDLMENIRQEKDAIKLENQAERDLAASEVLAEQKAEADRNKIQQEKATSTEIAKIEKSNLENSTKATGNYFQTKMNQWKAYFEFEKLTNKEREGAQASTINNLAALQNSGNSKMRAIGKAAALVQIGISTAEGAIKAYSALAGIPFVGPGLGIAAASALIAYGAERSAQVAGLAEGGIVMPSIGGTRAVIGEAGSPEAVIPLDSPAAEDFGIGAGENRVIDINLNLTGNLAEIVEEQQIENENLRISIKRA